MTAIESAEPERDPALPALVRMLRASSEELGRHEVIARAVAAELTPDAMRRAAPVRLPARSSVGSSTAGVASGRSAPISRRPGW